MSNNREQRRKRGEREKSIVNSTKTTGRIDAEPQNYVNEKRKKKGPKDIEQKRKRNVYICITEKNTAS